MVEAPPLYVTLLGLGTMLVLLALLRLGQRLLSPGNAGSSDFLRGNAARGMMQVGQVLGAFLIGAAAVKGCVHGLGLAHDVPRVAAFAVLGLALMMGIGHLGLRLLLGSHLPAELARGNVAAGVAAGGHYVATALITSRAVAGGDLHDLGIALAFFALGQLTLHVFITLFRALTVYDDAEQIQGENLAAALSYAGVSIAVGIIIGRALEGDFAGWVVSLEGYGEVLLFLLALYPVRQILVQMVLLGAPFALRGGRLDTGIAAERNAGLGALEAVTYIAAALAIAELL
jgi:uncharacterized membrane protein YjfL (UPF0719 family)